ncbi:MAG: class I SAM-dependent methyltransferase [Ruminococcaceae bacterium]|nr:class I SAM-dependent methyltransferase [Oscillospiraceae bacterium]
MYDGYRAIATAYDRFNADVDYEGWSDFIEACFDRYLPARPQIVLDLACGTGRMTFPLADRGYDMIGIDGSADMLAEAYEKNAERTDRLFDEACARLGIDPDGLDTDAAMEELAKHPAPLFLQQDMRDFELYGTVDATVCCLDSLNYLCGDGDLLTCLKCIHLYLAPGGLLAFDINSPYKFAHTYGNNAYILEDEAEDGRGIFCGWQNEYDPETRLCKFYLSLFAEDENGLYTRSDEEQTERCYDETELRAALDEAGFDLCGMFADFDFSPVTKTTERWYVVARTRKRGEWYLCEERA